MVRSQSFQKLLELKRERFTKAVLRICIKRNLKVSSLNFEGCSGEHEDQLAHYHPYSHMICISEQQLCKLNFEDIEKTAAHEVAHFGVHNHGPDFHEEEMINSTMGLEIPPGVVVIDGRYQPPPKGKYKKPVIDKVKCNYFLCRKEVKLSHCKYCKGYFCEGHFELYEPGTNSLGTGHPCPGYIKYNKEQEDKYTRALETWTSKSRVLPKKSKSFATDQIKEEPGISVNVKKDSFVKTDNVSKFNRSIEVYVKRFGIFPIKNREVHLLYDDRIVSSKLTNEQGKATFNELPNGTYSVSLDSKKNKTINTDKDVTSVSLSTVF